MIMYTANYTRHTTPSGYYQIQSSYLCSTVVAEANENFRFWQTLSNIQQLADICNKAISEIGKKSTGTADQFNKVFITDDTTAELWTLDMLGDKKKKIATISTNFI